MSNIYCKNLTCQHRSKRRSNSKNKKGEWLYKCTCPDIVLVPFNFDEYLRENEALNCLSYKKVEGCEYGWK